MFVALIAVSIVPIGMTVAMFVIFAVPVPFVVVPSIAVTVVVWMAPVSPRVGWSFVAAGNPMIVISLGRPEASYPHHLGRGWRWRRRLIGNGRRGDSDRNKDLA
jgi:hypothetical protein